MREVKDKAKKILAKYETLSREKLIELIRDMSPGQCDEVIYQRGTSATPVFATNMYTTEFLCKLLREMTGARLDWHYVGGRVNMLLHPDDQHLQKAVDLSVEMIGINSLNDPKKSFYARVYEIQREEIVTCKK